MTVTEKGFSPTAAELRQQAPPPPTSPSLLLGALSPLIPAAFLPSLFPPAMMPQPCRGTAGTRGAPVASTGVQDTPLSYGVSHVLRPAAATTGAPSSPRQVAPAADAQESTASCAEPGSPCGAVVGSGLQQRTPRHRVIRFHPEIFDPPRLPVAGTSAPSGTSSADWRRLAAQRKPRSTLTENLVARTGDEVAGGTVAFQHLEDASAAGAIFAAGAQRETLLAAFAAAAVADAAAVAGSQSSHGERRLCVSHGRRREKTATTSRKTGALASAAVPETRGAREDGRSARDKNRRGAAYQQQLRQMQAAAAADDAALLEALENEQEWLRQRKLQEEQERRRRQEEEEEERRRQEQQAREAAAAAAAREEQLRRERQAAEELRRRLEEEEAKRKAQEEEERRRAAEEEEKRRLEQQLQEQQRLQKEEEERQRQQREEEERQRREKEQQQLLQQAVQEQQQTSQQQEEKADVQLQEQPTPTESAPTEAGGTTADASATISSSNWLPVLDPGKPETAYMREVETLLAEERDMRETQLHQLPGVSKDQVKALRVSIKKQINTALNQLASTTSQIIRTCEGIRQFMRELKAQPPAVTQYFVVQACERLLQLTEKGGQVSTRPSSVWAYAFLVRGMVQEDEKVEHAFRAHVYATCCYAAPFYYRKKQGMSVEQFRTARGQREGEDEEAFFSRMAACLRLWLSFLIASHKEEEAWSWLARFLNLNLATVKAVRRVCACGLIEGLKIAGPALLKAYGRQFRKVMDLIQNALMPLLLTMQQKNEGTCISMYVTQLRTFVSDYYANNFTLPEPEGKSMKMEATEASPDV